MPTLITSLLLIWLFHSFAGNNTLPSSFLPYLYIPSLNPPLHLTPPSPFHYLTASLTPISLFISLIFSLFFVAPLHYTFISFPLPFHYLTPSIHYLPLLSLIFSLFWCSSTLSPYFPHVSSSLLPLHTTSLFLPLFFNPPTFSTCSPPVSFSLPPFTQTPSSFPYPYIPPTLSPSFPHTSLLHNLPLIFLTLPSSCYTTSVHPSSLHHASVSLAPLTRPPSSFPNPFIHLLLHFNTPLIRSSLL